MSIFGSIMHKIFHGADAAAATPAPDAPAGATTTSPAPGIAPDPFGGAASQPASAAPAAPVDVDKVLTDMAAKKGGGGNYRTSIVDLLKLLDLDPGLDARKELANELNVHAGPDGSAEENIALHKAVMAKLAENGGTVPASLRG